MKTIRNIAPALLMVAVLVALALGIGLMSRDGRRQPDTTPADDMPNSALSNGELVNKAVTNMRGLTSYRMEFNGPMPSSQEGNEQVTLQADVQQPGPDTTANRGSRYKFTRGESGTDPMTSSVMDFELIWASDGHWYESADGGKTGTRSEYAGLLYPYLTCCWYWDGFWNALEATPTKPPVAFSTPSSGASPSPGESSEATPGQFPPAASTTLVFEDGDPRLEKIEGVTTRHVVADVTGVWTQISIWAQISSGATSVWDWPEPPAKLELWVSMDEMPTVRKMTATGSASKGNIGTWTWSRFNEDFGVIEPPAGVAGVDATQQAEPTATIPFTPTPSGTAPADSSIRTLTGHTGTVSSIAFSPDGKTLASTSLDNTVRLWRVADGSTIGTFTGNTSWVHRAVFSPDGQLLAHAADNGTVMLWRVTDRSLVRTIESHDSDVWAVEFSPDGQLLATAASDAVKLWRVSDGAPVLSLNEAGSQIAFSPDGQMLASAVDRTIMLWQVSDGTMIRSFTEHHKWVNAVAFSPDGQTLASASADWTLKLWKVADGTVIHTLAGHEEVVRNVVFSPDGQMLASSSPDDTVRLWRAADGTAIETLTGHTDSVIGLAFSPDGKLLATSSSDGTVKLWRMK